MFKSHFYIESSVISEQNTQKKKDVHEKEFFVMDV